MNFQTQKTKRKERNKMYKNMLIVILIVLFSVLSGVESAKSRMMIMVKEKEKKLMDMQIRLHKEEFFLKTCLIAKEGNYRFPKEAIMIIAETAWQQSEFYHMPQSRDLFLACVTIETKFNNHAVGSNGERTFVQFMPETYEGITGEELTEEKIQNLKHITEQWFKLIALYTFTYYDNEKVFIAYNCGEKLLSYFRTTKEIKQWVYLNRDLEYYPEKVLRKYEEFVHYILR